MRNRKRVTHGAAAFHAELSEGVLTVRHTDEHGRKLLRVPLYEGDWSELWRCMESLGDTSQQWRVDR
jgi:hypothetical protein